ncbi:MAG: alpha/beta hydrolase [Thermodesulfobacteriota bacterium]
MKNYLSIKKYGLEHLVLFSFFVFLTFAIISCDSGSNNDDNSGGNPTPTPTASPTPTPTVGPTPSPTASPTPSPAPGGSIIEPGGTLSMVAQTFDYVGNGNERQMLDYYAISGLLSQTVSDFSTSGVLAARPALVFFHGGAWVLGDRGEVDPLIFDAAEIAGFHVVSVGYRLATEDAWPAQIHDANSAIRWIKQNAGELGINPDKLIIVGGSAGAHIGGAVAAASDVDELQGTHNLEPPTSTEVAMAVLIFGAYNMNMIVDDGLDLVMDGTCGVEDLGPGLAAVLLLLDCPPSFNLLDPLDNCSQNDLDSSSPELFADSTDPPMYLAHGRDDCTVPYQQTLGMADALEAAGGSVSEYNY